MPISITINGSVTLDESAGLQTGGAGTATEDNNDSDILLSTLQTDVASFYDRLFGVGELNLSSAFATANGVARSASNYIALSGTGSVISLGFFTSSGAALPVLGSGTGAPTNLFALDGGAISLFVDPASELGNRVVYGVDEDGDIVFAMFMEPAANLLTARVWMVQFEAMDNPDATNHDDPLAMTGLGVGAGVSTEFNFAGLPSGQNLFGMVGTTGSGIIVFGQNTVLNADGTFTNASNTINTSQGGGNTTIGVNNQMFDPGDGAYFTYVRGADSNFLGFNLDANEADDADNMLYTDGNGATNDTIESDGAFLKIAQLQGGGTATMRIDAYNITGSPQGQALIAASGQNAVEITRVKVYDSAGNLLADSNVGNANGVTFNLGGLSAIVGGLDDGYKVEWFTNGVHDQVKITGVAGKFDIGGFGINEPSAVATPLSGVRFEDDGPSISGTLTGAPNLTVDESALGTDDTESFAGQFTPVYGTDGAGASPVTYALSTPGGNSGIVDTATGNSVFLFLEGGKVVGREGTDATDAATGEKVFEVSVDASGNVTLDQVRSIVHPTLNPDESKSLLAANLVVLTATATDGDDDVASTPLEIGQLLIFKDDGPSLPPVGQPASPLVTDDSDIADLATLSTDDIFPGPPVFGNDGPHAVTPIDYTLRLVTEGGDSGLIDTATGKAILLKTVGSDIVGYVDANGDGILQAGETLEAVRYSLTVVDSDTELVNFTQSRAVVHANVNDPDEAGAPETIAANLVLIDRIAKDGDGDVSEVVTFDLGAFTFLKDDGPDIGPVADGLVDFALNDSVTKTLNGDVGNDPNASPYILTNFTPSLVVNGVTVTGVLAGDSKSVTYWANTNGNGVIGDAGDTAYYRLELGSQGGAGDYTFTVLIDPPPAFTEFTFDLLPSGANLFGVVTSGNSALLVMGENPVFNAAGNYTNASDVIHTSQGGDGATIGVNNQMFDPGDGAYFTFINDPDPNFISGIPGGLDSTEADDIDNVQYNEDGIGPPTKEVMSAFLGISQTQSNKPVSMTIEAFNITGGPQEEAFAAALGQNHVDITAVRVFDGDGNDVTASVSISIVGGVATVGGLLRGYTVEWDTAAPHDQVLVTGATGKFDVGRFGFLQGNDTPDQLLEFTAQVTDGDGDFDSASWKVGIDGTGVFDDDSVSGIII